MLREELAEKLKQLNRDKPIQVTTASQLLKNKAAEPDYPDLTRFIPGEAREIEGRTCFVSEDTFPHSHCIGGYEVSNLAGLNAASLMETFCMEPGENPDGKVLFLDTETTGLAGGAGTSAFMIGIGSVEPDGFRVAQYFMRDYDEEEGQLSMVAEELRQAAMLVTYNGAYFDLPLLRTRLILNRIRMKLMDIPHLDLLPFARRLWKPSYGAANLSFLESKVLGSEREGDIPGSLIPTVYFQYLRGGSPRMLAPVFYHNRQDILSLAALTQLAWKCHAQPSGIESLWERHGVARFYMKNNYPERALEVLAPSESLCIGEKSWQSCMMLKGLLHKKQRDYATASSIWRVVVEAGTFDPIVYIELAKYYEHIERNFEKALGLVQDVYAHFGRDPRPAEDGAVAVELEEAEDDPVYDYSEHAPISRDDTPAIRLDSEDPGAIDNSPGGEVLLWSERLEAELEHRMRRLKQKISRLRS